MSDRYTAEEIEAMLAGATSPLSTIVRQQAEEIRRLRGIFASLERALLQGPLPRGGVR